MRAAPTDAEAPTFGALLRDLRLASGLSQEALAERAHMSSGGISVLERGTRRAPQRETMRLLADALQLSSDDRLRLEQAARRSGSARRRNAPNTPSAAAEVGNLPFALTTFVGRERSSASLRDIIAEHRLVTVTGTGGVGKTRLAIEVAHAVCAQFPDGVWLVELAPLTDGESVGPRVAATFGLSPEGGFTLERLIAELSDRRCVIVLDNCEHVLTACAAFAVHVLQHCEGVRILATSRERLHVPGERVCRVDPLSEFQAIQLFIDRAQSLAPTFDFEADETTRGYVQSICRSLDGIPLAVELAAARVPSLSLKAIAENLNKRLSLLRNTDSSAPSRQQTMQTMIDWSYDLLSVEEQRMFACLSIFAGGCSLEAASIVCSDESIDDRRVLDVLTSLVDKSMIVVDVAGHDLRYSLLEITGEYARERLLSSPEFDRVAARHAQVYHELAQRVEPRGSIPDALWQSIVEPELENWRAALQWTLEDRHGCHAKSSWSAPLIADHCRRDAGRYDSNAH